MLRARPFAEESGPTLARAADGDVAALASLVVTYQDDMARVCAIVTGDAELAEDAVQAAWPVAWRKLGTLRDPARLRPWLISIAANQARQLARRERRRRVLEVRVTVAASGPDLVHHRAALADLGVALERLSAEERTLLALRYVAELSSEEIGAALGISASGARSRLERLLLRLREELDDD